ncbi:CpsD/CapB family tyrosine-protein kinase [Natroniella acetigena]|uniref:CpsD/CapB family tyrosine-protein kinase n=1 Tax=Natroniella acetigena TaxID=52004 RepID=UPI00200A0A70|nr:CpsD/CapB family tyrosine-protein kinase [Natroniella acetigena]MCK8827675.1 CpsD/CapB family tyrosine-protein kinase [Natroniella acetigena]
MGSSRRNRSDELIVEYDPKSPAAEAYRTLRTNISFLSPDDPLTKISLSSSGPSEGKSLTVANLAISMAQNNKDVIVIDADLRKPMQHKFYGMTNFAGLSNVLTGEIGFAEGLQETGIDGLRLLTTGTIPPNPSELLNSKKMEEVIKQAEAESDMLIIDTPPVIAVTDTAILATKVDGILLVIASHEAEQDMVVKAKEQLDKVQANVIGTVLNKYPIDKGRGYQNYYYYYGGESVDG